MEWSVHVVVAYDMDCLLCSVAGRLTVVCTSVWGEVGLQLLSIKQPPFECSIVDIIFDL